MSRFYPGGLMKGVTHSGGTPTPTPTPAPSWSVNPSITTDGTPQTGETVTGNDGTISNGTVSTRAWLRNGTAISGATAGTYTLQVADESQSITFRVTATGAGGTTSQASSAITPAAAGTFNPTSLFGAGDSGYIIDATTAANLFKADQTTQVTAVNDAIGKITDLSGKGKHFVTNTSNSGAPAAWKTLGGINCVQGDGSTSLLESGSFAKSSTTGWTRIFAFYLPTDPAHLVIGDGTGSGVYSNGQLDFGSGGSLHAGIYDGSFFDAAAMTAVTQWFVLTEVHHGASSSLQKNQGTAVTGDAGSSTCDGTTICGGIFAGRVTTGYAAGIEINRVLTGTEITNAVKWVGAKAGLSL